MMQKPILTATLFAILVGFAAAETLLTPGGDFEQSYKQSLYIHHMLHDSTRKNIPPQEAAHSERVQSEKVFAGEKALLLETKLAGHEINTRRDILPVVPGAKYQFSFRYFIAAAGPRTRVSGRVAFTMADGSHKYRFPSADGTPGKWHQLKIDFYPPVGTVKMSATLWFTDGPYKIYVDDIRVTVSTGAPEVNLAAGAGILAELPVGTLWKQSNFRRVDAVGIPEAVPKRSAVELSLAANEREPFQLVLTPKQDVPQLTLHFSDLKGSAGTIPAELQSYGILKFVPMRNPDNPTLKGELADPIIPAQPVDAKAGKNTIFFIKLYAPATAAPGVYRGNLTLRSGEEILAEVPLQLRVRSFTLPETAWLRTFFYALVGHIIHDYKDSRSVQEIADDVSAILHDHRINGNQCIKPPAPKYDIEGETLRVTDWSNFDAFVFRQWQKFGICNFTVPILGMLGDNSGWFSDGKQTVFGEPLFSERARNLAGQYARQLHEHWLEAFPPQLRYFCYIYDEPAVKVYEELNRLTGEIKRQAPEFRFFTPHAVDPKLPHFTVFAVPFDFGMVNPELQRGRETWYYNWPHPLDHHNYIKNRLFAWQIYANDGEGGLSWQMTATPGPEVNPWTDLEKTYGNGHNTTLFPALSPGGGLVPTLRLAQIREGLDDVDYLKLLEAKVDRHFPGHGRARVAEVMQELLPELPFGFVNDSNLLYALREKIATEIEDFEVAPVALVCTNPPENSATEISRVQFTVLAPAGAKVAIAGKPAGVIQGGRLQADCELTRLGENIIAVGIEHQGRTRKLNRRFVLKRDPNLQKLEELADKMEKSSQSTDAERAFLQAHASGNYTQADREACSRLLAEAQKRLIAARLSTPPPTDNALLTAVRAQAQLMYEQQLYGRATYYLDMAESFAQAKPAVAGPLRFEPVNLEGKFGFRIANDQIEFTLLELGGRIISFKVRGTETLYCGDLAKTLPLKIRASKQHQNFSHHNLPDIGGYADAGLELLPESAVDWNLSVKEISETRLALEASMLVRSGQFRLSRVMSIVPGSPELKIDYSIRNVFPTEYVSDDPTHHQFNWRGRLMPSIGDGRQGDTLEVPTTLTLPTTVFDLNKPVYFLRSVPLNDHYLGVFNPEKQAGFTWKLDPQLNDAFIWMNSRDNHLGTGKVYALEVFRSHYGNQPGEPGNRPFDIKPGQEVNFSISLIGRKD
ncbi:MAG: DUF4091 domain-containing protein [Lentisphaerae bacterium]|jgi:hypothetical protein|nr:DUF4091 domain-containing protein [Lentisphaerota bacterium]